MVRWIRHGTETLHRATAADTVEEVTVVVATVVVVATAAAEVVDGEAATA
jgi:hypothetical protein